MIRCPLCGGSGLRIGPSDTEVRRRQQEVQRLQDRLAKTPRVTVQQAEADWPYTIEYHERAVALEAALRINYGATGRPVVADSLRKTRRIEDTVIQNANPGIGLAAKTLKLPTEEELVRELVEDAAQEAAGRIVAAVAVAHAAERQAESNRLLAEGKTAEAVEAGADAAVLKEVVGRGQGAALLTALRERLRADQRRDQSPPSKTPG